MTASQAIAAKRTDLKNKGMDVGNPVGELEDAGSGGFVQKYQLGNIYWHASTGAHEVHGGILNAFLAYGGVGKNPTYGVRLLGYPVSDEMSTKDKIGRVSYFEWGAIYWNTAKGIRGNAVWGECFKQFKAAGEVSYPVTSTKKTSIGEITYFEISCLWKPNNAYFLNVIQMTLNYPKLGLPLILQPDTSLSTEFANYPFIICGLKKSEKDKLEQLYPGFMQTIWNNNIGLQPVLKSISNTQVFNVSSLKTLHEADTGTVYYFSTARLLNNPKLKDSILYNLVIRGENDYWSIASPHCFYVKNAWDNFAAIHATDLHVSRRLDKFRKILKDKNQPDGVNNFNNFNDGLRDLIIYANHLHRSGSLHLLIITGDIIDYIFENDDDRNGPGNFEFFKKIILGQAPYTDKDFYTPNSNKIHEELLVPIFTTLGNHDYRPNAYDLIARVDIGDLGPIDVLPFGWEDLHPKQYGSMNLTKKEAIAILGQDHIYYDMYKAASKVEAVGKVYQYGMINQVENFVIKLGKNRLVMVNTEMDMGIIGVDAETALKKIFGFLNESQKNFVETNPDSVGLTDEKLSMIKRTLQETGDDGVVILAMHAPPVNPKNNEYPHYFRETEHPQIDKTLINDYLQRADPTGFYVQGGQQHPEKPFPDWLRTESLNFKKKDPGELLDYGGSKGKQEELLKLSIGQMGTRKINLILCGHVHRRVEYRLGWSEVDKHLRYYMDFYTENPKEYYKSKYKNKSQGVRIYVNPNSSVGEPVNTVDDHRQPFAPWQKNYVLSVPTYKNPLNSSTNPSDWWKNHSPLIVQTAALGPVDANNRADKDENPEMPGPAFTGFRYIKITNNIISKMYYVTLSELRKNNFQMPWE